MADSTPVTHCEAEQASQLACEQCGTLFASGRVWTRFCGDRCRNDFHTAERRKKAIRARALDLFTALRKIAEGHHDPIGVNSQVAADAIKGLVPPEEPIVRRRS